jgi:hypothetical protein
MQTGWPAMMRKSAAKSARCMGRRRSSTARRAWAVSAKIISRIMPMRSPRRTCARCGTGRCLGLEVAGDAGVLGRVGVGAHPDVAELVRPGEKRAEVVVEGGVEHGRLAHQDLSGGAVDGDRVALGHRASAGADDDAAAAVDLELRRRRRRKAGRGRGR